MQLRYLAAFLGLALPLAAGCRSDEALNAPDLSNNSALLQRYVSMGNSITAGFQSAGINDSTQLQSYAVLFAAQAKAPFFEPLLNKAGCPPPFVINVTQTRLPELDGKATTPTTCDLRTGTPLPYVSNVAVPGVTSFGIEDNTSPFGGTNALTQFILGGRTQVKAMMDAQPTFVSVWIGNNDVLGSLTNLSGPHGPGNPDLVTPEPAFEANYGPILDSIQKVGAKAVLIAVADVTLIPYASSGASYWCIRNQPACGFTTPVPFPDSLFVKSSCAPISTPIPGAKGDSVLVPWTVGVPKIATAAAGVPDTINCSIDSLVVLPSEYKTLRDAVQGYNAYIAAQAQQRGWAYVDIDELAAYKEDPTKIATFPTLPTGPSQPNVLFGSYFSLDGVHPSAAFHRVIADSIISGVNRTYGTTIPFVGP